MGQGSLAFADEQLQCFGGKEELITSVAKINIHLVR